MQVLIVIMPSTAGRATVTLTSTLDGGQVVCPGEVVTYTCIALRTTVVTWFVLPDIDVDYFPTSSVGGQPRVIRGFQLTLTGNVPDPTNPTTIADLTITLTVTATLARNGTVVQCRGDDPSERMSLTLNIASEHSMVYVCMYVCMYVCIYICMYICIYVCMYASSFVDVMCIYCIYHNSLFFV